MFKLIELQQRECFFQVLGKVLSLFLFFFTPSPVAQEKHNRFPILDPYFRVFKEYPQKSQIWQSETSPSQGIPNQVPWLGLVGIWVFWGYSLKLIP